MNRRHYLTAAAIVLAVLTLNLAAKPPKDGGSGPTYQVIELQTAGEAFDCYPHDMNDSGLIVGTVNEPLTNASAAVCWVVDQSGAVTSTLHYLNNGDKAYGVNNRGEIVGWRSGAGSDFRAVYWADRSVSPLDLGPLAGDTDSTAEAINNQGVICGYSLRAVYGPDPNNPNGDPIFLEWAMRPVVWKVTEGSVEGPVELPAPNQGSATVAVAINDNDSDGVAQVVGYGFDALVWDVASEADGSLTAESPTVLATSALAGGVNNSAVICGQIWPTGVVWSGNSTQTLDMSATFRVGRERRSFDSARATAINSTAGVAGSALSGLISRAVVWQAPNQPMVLLDNFLSRSPFAHLDGAVEINDSGSVVGYGTNAERGFTAGFLAIRQ